MNSRKKFIFRRNRIILIEDKLKAIELAKEKGNHKAAKEFGVDRKSIRYWRNQEMRLKEAFNKEQTITILPSERINTEFDISKLNEYFNFQLNPNMKISEVLQLIKTLTEKERNFFTSIINYLISLINI